MASARLESSARFSVADYLGWTDEERWELVDGRRYSMKPTPTPDHQRTQLDLYDALQGALNQASASKTGPEGQRFVDPTERHAELFRLGPDGKFGPSRVMLPEEALEVFGLSLGLLQEILGPEVPE